MREGPDRFVRMSDLIAFKTEIRAEMAAGSKLLREEMAAGSKLLREEMAAGSELLRGAIASQSAEDRRWFKILLEEIRDSIRIVAEGTAHNAGRLENHESRIKAIEDRA